MKRKVAIASVFLVMLSASFCGCIKSSSDNDGKVFDKAGALEFSLKVVQTYFDDDFDTFMSYLDDKVFVLEGGGPISKDDAEDIVRQGEYLANEEYPRHTMEEYLETYDPKVLDVNEVKAEQEDFVDTMRELGWKYDGNDYLFIGWETKDGEDGFLWDDPLVFGVTSEDHRWTFKAFSS